MIALAAIIFETDSLPPGALASVAKWPDEIRGETPPAWGEPEKKEAKRYDVSLRNGQVKTNSHGDDPYVEAVIVTPSKQTYVRNHIAPAEEQLMKATVRLAALLNAIDWK